MRLSSLSPAVILLLSTFAFAQHTASSNPSSPPPSPPPSAAPSPVHSSSPAPAPSPAPSIPHSSPPSTPAPSTAPVNHIAPSSTSFGNHSSGPATSEPSRTAPVAHVPESNTGRVTSGERITGEGRIVPAPRIGEGPPEKIMPGDPSLRKRICVDGPCEEPRKEPTPPASDLRRRICLNGPCTCPAGETASKGGCVASSTVNNENEQCGPGQVWNGGSCVVSTQCPAGENWNGANCATSSAECASIGGRAAILTSELRSISARVREACSQQPSGDECMARKSEQQGALQRYQMLLNEAGPTCRTGLPDPLALM